jgi:hypothetical protein
MKIIYMKETFDRLNATLAKQLLAQGTVKVIPDGPTYLVIESNPE